MEKILVLENLNFNYKNKEIIKSINLQIQKGDFITIIGAIGSGKTTLMQILNNKLNYKGNLKFNCFRQEVGFCNDVENIKFFQDKVIDEIKSILMEYKLSQKEIELRLTEIDKNLNISYLFEYSTKYLSTSEKQFINLVKSLIIQPKILILDDALLFLDNIQRKKIFKYLKKLNSDQKMTIINITSSVEDCIFGKKIALLNNGQIILNDRKYKSLACEKDFRKANLELPFLAELSIKLGYYGLLNKIVLDKNKMVNIIWK